MSGRASRVWENVGGCHWLFGSRRPRLPIDGRLDAMKAIACATAAEGAHSHTDQRAAARCMCAEALASLSRSRLHSSAWPSTYCQKKVPSSHPCILPLVLVYRGQSICSSPSSHSHFGRTFSLVRPVTALRVSRPAFLVPVMAFDWSPSLPSTRPKRSEHRSFWCLSPHVGNAMHYCSCRATTLARLFLYFARFPS